jgi:hypothetical protein
MRPAPSPAWLALPLLVLALAGCASPPTLPPGPSGPEGAQGLANVRVTTANGPASEVTLAGNPKDPRNLVGGAKDFTLGTDPAPGCSKYNVWSGVYWSRDGGATWGNALMPGYPGDANATLLSHYTCNSDPVVVFGADGTAYYSGLAYGSAQGASTGGLCPGDQAAPLCGGSVWLARSQDGGATWGDFVNVAVSDSRTVGLDKQWFATDPSNAGNLVMTWIQFTAVAAYFLIAASFDGGLTWTPPLTLAELDAPVHQFAMPQFGNDGSVYVVWHNFGAAGPTGLPPPAVPLPVGQPGTPQVMFTKTQAAGSPSFTPAVGIAPVHDIRSPLANGEFRTTSIPSLAVQRAGPHAGTLYVVWADQQGDQSDILFVKSSDGGATWSAPAKVNQDATANDQFMTWVTTDEEGGVDVAFYDRGYDANNTLLDLTVARSVDDGATWRQVRVTTQSWAVPEGCYHQQGFPFIGDYMGLVASDGALHPFWADGRSGRCEVMTASIPYSAVSGAPSP